MNFGDVIKNPRRWASVEPGECYTCAAELTLDRRYELAIGWQPLCMSCWAAHVKDYEP